jgi:hypothetical protein
VEYISNSNAAKLWNSGHTKGWSCTGEVEQKKKIKNLNMGGILSIWECI